MVSIVRRWRPSIGASWKRFGPGECLRGLVRIWRAIRERWARLAFSWRLLRDGCCDGCSVGTAGLRDWVTGGIHACGHRLRRLRLDTIPEFDPGALESATALRRLSSSELRGMGRLPAPMLRRKGERGFRPIGWDEALDLAAARIGASSPGRLAFLLGGWLANETCYVAQKAVRALGTNSVDCDGHAFRAPGALGLRQALGVDASTCSLEDWMHTDVIVLVGSDVLGGHPSTRRYLRRARRAGAKVAVVDICRRAPEESGLPSAVVSALLGSNEADRYFLVDDGGEVAFLNGALKHMLERRLLDGSFVRGHTEGLQEVEKELADQDWEQLERASGAQRGEMAALGEMLGGARRAVLAWDADAAFFTSPEDAVRGIANLALTRGLVGRPGCGLMPLVGPAFAQGAAAMGASPAVLPGGAAVGGRGARRLTALWGFKVPSRRGLAAAEMAEAARRGRLALLFSAGGDLAGVPPEPEAIDAALARVPLRVYLDVALSSQMLAEPAEAVLLLPATTRHETSGGVTWTSAERRVIFCPEIPGTRVAQARDAWRVFAELAARVRPDRARELQFEDTAAVRRDIARTVTAFECIELLSKKGDHFQVGGPRLCGAWTFPTVDGKAHFQPVAIPIGERRAQLGRAPARHLKGQPALAGSGAGGLVDRRAPRAGSPRRGEARAAPLAAGNGPLAPDARPADPGP